MVDEQKFPTEDEELTSSTVEYTSEGKKVWSYTTRYEQSANNRDAAIKIRGTVCQDCGFDFENTY